MTVREFLLPDLGEGLVEAVIVAWSVAVGDEVEIDQGIVEVESAKSVVELPDAPPQPYRARRAGVPRGDVSVERVAGAPVWHYASAGAEDDAPMVVVLDGSLWAGELDLPTTLDNLVADRAIPPLRATMVDTGAGDTRAALLLDNDDFVAWLAGDLLDALNVAGPAMVAGQSLGGLSALRAALARPDRFSAVLAQSASLWTPAADRLPVRAGARAYLEVGTDEWINAGPNAAFAERLAAAGSAVEFREFRGGHDRACWRGGIADGLISLLG